MDKGESAVRISRLKKRQRSKDCDSDVLPPSSKPSHPRRGDGCSSNRSCSQASAVVMEHKIGNDKLPLLENNSSSLMSIPIIESGESSSFAASGRGVPNSLHRSDSSFLSSESKRDVCGPCDNSAFPGNHHSHLHSKDNEPSLLAFIGTLKPSNILASIPYMLGIDVTSDVSSFTFRKELERAFECHRKYPICFDQKKSSHHFLT